MSTLHVLLEALAEWRLPQASSRAARLTRVYEAAPDMDGEVVALRLLACLTARSTSQNGEGDEAAPTPLDLCEWLDRELATLEYLYGITKTRPDGYVQDDL
jgi:hypothetical protein